MAEEKVGIKLVVVGNNGAGKTCLLISYANNNFPSEYVPTVFDSYVVPISVGGKSIELGLWDTNGSSDFDSLRALSYPQTDVYLIIYSIADPTSFDDAECKWWPEVKWATGNNPHPTLEGHFAARREKQGKPPKKNKSETRPRQSNHSCGN